MAEFGFVKTLWCLPISGSGLIWFTRLPFFIVSLISRLVVLGCLLILPGLMKNSERPGFPTFVALDKGIPALKEFNEEVVGWLPLLPEVHLPPLTGNDLFQVVRGKTATAGCFDGWGWSPACFLV